MDGQRSVQNPYTRWFSFPMYLFAVWKIRRDWATLIPLGNQEHLHDSRNGIMQWCDPITGIRASINRPGI
jgi:hypothetical protein